MTMGATYTYNRDTGFCTLARVSVTSASVAELNHLQHTHD